MFKALWNFIGHTLIILKQEHVNHGQLLSTYIRLSSRNLVTKRHRRGVLRLIDYSVEYFDYLTVVSLFEEIFVNRTYFFTSSTPFPSIIDCGSNIGMSVLFFKHLYPQSKILAFEPDHNTFGLLERNIEENMLGDVTLINKAVYSSNGSSNFYSDPNEAGSLVMSLYPRAANMKQERVETVRLSTYIEAPVDFLKLDVEGAETMVIEEVAQSGKLPLIRQLVIEYHHHTDENDDALSNLLTLFETHGFGYQICAEFRMPFKRRKFQDILIYCYQK